MVFESPIKDGGSVDIEPKNGKPVWQNYKYYYIYPSVKNSPNADKRTLYCRTEDRGPKNSTPIPLISINSNYLTDTEISGTTLRVVGREVYEINFEQVGTGLIISIKFEANVYDHSSVKFENREIKEVIELKASVIPEN